MQVGHLTLPGGMLYVGTGLRAASGHSTEPALIDPRLRTDFRRPDWSANTVGYWPSYSDISPAARAAYLTWLAGGRQETGVPISWIFLFFYGLERRVLVDAPRDPAARAELPAIDAEVRRLLSLYGANNSFHSYAGNFLSLVEFSMTSTDNTEVAPAVSPKRWPVPLRLRAGLGEFAADGTPVPADWAFAWAMYHPEIYPRTPATRCPEEFAALFQARYTAQHGAGLKVRATKTMLEFDYYAASAGLRSAKLSTHLPDVLTQAAPSKKLAALMEDCAISLDAYSRHVGRRPEAKGTLAATVLLPPELLVDAGGELARLTAFVDRALDGQPAALVDAAELLAFWPATSTGKLAKADAVALAQALATQGIGVEPDVRFGGPTPAPDGAAVLFRTEPGQPTTPSPEYAAAAVLLHLAAAVSIADGHVSDAETAHLADHLESAMHLSVAERRRLHAHLQWLLAGQVKLTGLTKRLAELEQPQREAIGDFLATVAAADGQVSPQEVTTLTKIFKLLALDPASVYSRLHAATTGSITAPAAEPVTVRSATPGQPGYAIPPRPDADSRDAGTRPAGSVRLDEAAVAAKLAETAAVSALLGSIFADDEPATDPVAAAPSTTLGGPTLAGLDGAHSQLLRTLAARDSWPRADLEAACEALGLLPDGALDTLNEAAYDTAGDPLTDGDDPVTIDPHVAQEMQA